MKMRRIGKILLVWLCIITLLLPFGAEVLAAAALTSESETAMLETIALRQGGPESSGTVTSDSYDTTPYSYTVGGVNVLKIIQTGDSDYTDMFYCINAGASFPTRVTDGFVYNNRGDFTDLNNSDVAEWYESVGMTEDTYNALVYLLNNVYLMKQNTEYKTIFIQNAFADKLAEESLENGYNPPLTVQDIMTILTDDDIDVLQQWAIWYFTNGSNSQNAYYDSIYSALQAINVRYAELDNGNLTEQETQLSGTRLEYAGILYNYLVTSAQEAVTNGYDASTSYTYPTIDTTNAVTSTVDGSYYKVGPFKVNSGTFTPSDFALSLKFYDANGTELTNVDYSIYVNGAETEVPFNEIFDQEYYIYLPIENNTVARVELTSNYSKREITLWEGEPAQGFEDLQEVVLVTEEPVTETVTGTITEVKYDLALRKFIVSINNEATGREPVVSGLEELASGASTTAIYSHEKNPLTVEVGDRIVYEFRIYNEGDVDARVGTIVDYIPDGLSVVSSTESVINSNFGWTVGETANGYTTVTTDYLANPSIPAFDKENLSISYLRLQIELEVTGNSTTGTVLTNVAEIIQDDGTDRDSNTGSISPDSITNNFTGNTSNKEDLSDPDYFYKGLEDDDDFEKVIINGDVFDLALQKFITTVNGEEYDREPDVDVSPLNNGGIDANYTTTKTPVNVQTGDIVTFTIRVYNEGDIDGYANQITDYIPEGLGFLVNYQTNYDNYWSIGEDATSVKLTEITNGTENLSVEDFIDVDSLEDVEVVLGGSKVTSTALSYSATSTSNLIPAFDGTTLSYKDVQITCIVTAEDEVTLKNIAAITGEKDDEGNDVETDRDDPNIDSTPVDDINPDDYTTGNEDDDDYDVLKTSEKDFDLALQKFITGLNDQEITDRVPTLTTDDEGNIVYTHTSEALAVGNGDIVTYTIRVYNEGDIDGYAAEIIDDIPTGLRFLPDNEINTQYGWEMLDSSGNVTTDVNQAVSVRTTYLSRESSVDNLIHAFDKEAGLSDTNPDYKDVRLVFQVDETAINKTTTTEERTLINTAEISKDTDGDGNEVEDTDSTPGNGNPDEDDIDQEKVYLKYFDLALKKDLASALVTVDGNSTQYNVGEGEDSIRVDVDRKKVNSTTIQFYYYITVTNEGEIAGYATEITDYIPEGLYFEASDNPDWAQVSDRVITTDALAKTLLQPGESASVQVCLRWQQSAENTGRFVNIAEISEDWNEYDSPDVDSTPNNQVPTEDDYDTAPVLVSIATGLGDGPYIILTTAVLTILGTGIFLIKKYVL